MNPLLDQARRLLDDLPVGLQAALIARMLQPRGTSIPPDEQRLEERLKLILTEHADPDVEARILLRDAVAAYRRADFEEGAALARAAYAKAVEAGNIALAATLLDAAGRGFMYAGTLDRFERHSRELLDFSRKWHLRQEAGFASQYLAGIYLLRRALAIRRLSPKSRQRTS